MGGENGELQPSQMGDNVCCFMDFRPESVVTTVQRVVIELCLCLSGQNNNSWRLLKGVTKPLLHLSAPNEGGMKNVTGFPTDRHTGENKRAASSRHLGYVMIMSYDDMDFSIFSYFFSIHASKCRLQFS